jgi:hypothetical protein
MKKNKIIVIIILSLLLFTILLTVVMNFVLKIYYEHEMELQDQLMCKTIEENNEYYTDFSEEFFNIFIMKADFENGTYPYPFSLSSVKNEMKTPLNNDLIGDWAYVRHINIEGEVVWYVELEYPYYIYEFEFWFGYSRIYYRKYSVIYIQNEDITDSDLEVITGYRHIPQYRKGKLLIKRCLENRYPT